MSEQTAGQFAAEVQDVPSLFNRERHGYACQVCFPKEWPYPIAKNSPPHEQTTNHSVG